MTDQTQILLGLQPLIRKSAETLVQLYEQRHGCRIRVCQGNRSWRDQEEIYAQGRTKPGPNPTPDKPLGKIVSWARPGGSFHNFGLAFDVCFEGKDPWLDDLLEKDEEAWKRSWEEIGIIGEEIGLRWGGRGLGKKKRIDRPHFEAAYVSIEEARRQWPNGWDPKREDDHAAPEAPPSVQETPPASPVASQATHAPVSAPVPPPFPAYAVKPIQRALRSLGTDPGPEDGIPGPQTAAALRNLSQAIRTGGGSRNRTAMMELQKALSEIGAYKGRIDGIGGPMTAGAIDLAAIRFGG